MSTVAVPKKEVLKRYSISIGKSEDGKYWVVYNKSTGKILKSINYAPVKFDSILPKKA